LIASADPRDISNLMSRAGFSLLTVDVDEVSVAYPSMWELLDDLRDMGESNAIIGRWAYNRFVFHAKLMIDLSRHLLRRDTLAAASAIYKGMVESYSLGALTTWTFRAPRTRGWHGASYVPGHLSSQLHLLCNFRHTHGASVDWVETCTPAAKAVREGLGQNEPQRCSLVRKEKL
jgi:hypothetical protein